MTAIKLTAPQEKLLRQANCDDTLRANMDYPPAKHLVAIGFGEFGSKQWGAPPFRVTPAGREWLRQKDEVANVG